MKFFKAFFAVAAAGFITLGAADLSKIADAKRWAPYECTVVQSGNSITVNMPVDHKAGEVKYPIGWPRTYLKKLTAAEKDWSKAKALAFKIKLEFTGKTANPQIHFQIRTQGPKDAKDVSNSRLITGLVNNKEVTAVIPFDKMNNLDNVVCLGINICEDKYKHGENVKITVGDFKLISK